MSNEFDISEFREYTTTDKIPAADYLTVLENQNGAAQMLDTMLGLAAHHRRGGGDCELDFCIGEDALEAINTCLESGGVVALHIVLAMLIGRHVDLVLEVDK